MMRDFRGKTALITGASSGIGREFARALAGRGCNLFLVARSEEKLAQVCAEAAAMGIRADYMKLDLSRDGAGGLLFGDTERRGLVINAGFGAVGSSGCRSSASWR